MGKKGEKWKKIEENKKNRDKKREMEEKKIRKFYLFTTRDSNFLKVLQLRECCNTTLGHLGAEEMEGLEVLQCLHIPKVLIGSYSISFMSGVYLFLQPTPLTKILKK